MSRIVILLTLLISWVGLQAQEMPRTEAPDNARVYFISPTDGTTVESPVTIRFGLSGMGVAPAGADLDNTGHHHLLINVDADALPPMNQSLPATEQIVHFGGGQTETSLALEPGEYRLQLLLGDHLHIPHDPPILSEVITITVE